MTTTFPLAFGMPGMTEWIIIGALGLLIFGKRLPEVGKGLGRSIVEFKRGLKGIEDDVEQVDVVTPTPPRRAIADESRDFKFDPHTGKPVERDATSDASSSSSSPSA